MKRSLTEEEKALPGQLAAEFERQEPFFVSLQLSDTGLLALLSYAKLGLRHPDAKKLPSAAYLRDLLRRAIDQVPLDRPVFRRLLELGLDGEA